jgi:N-acyl-D-aspartate/D-glutamate deacylase
MGNCGVGFAPCKPTDHTRLIQLMEGVEDIPEPVLSAGIPWAWESFPDYMDWLSKRNFDIDIGAQLPHAALRVYVMGERGARRDPSTPRTTRRWHSLRLKRCAQARLASPPHARSITAPRRRFHADAEGRRGRTHRDCGGMQTQARSVLQFVLDLSTVNEDLPMMLRVAENAKCPITFSITQNDRAPRRWRQTLDEIGAATKRGLNITAQIAARPVGLLLGLELSRNPFQTHPSYKAIAHLPLAERLARLRQPEVRAAILSETASATDDPLFFKPNYDKIYLLGNPPTTSSRKRMRSAPGRARSASSRRSCLRRDAVG